MASYMTVRVPESAGTGWRAAASSARERMSSLANAWVRCVSTVRGVTYSRSAMARLPCPRAASSATRCSAGVSAPGPLSALRRGRAPTALSSSRAPGQPQHAAAIRLLQERDRLGRRAG
jgi:hypothetical protein